MTLYFPGSLELAERLNNPDHLLVACFCAGWCDTCQQYQPKLEQLSAQHQDISFVWIDIEDYPDLVGDEDVENFPTILINKGEQNRFAGTILPHIEHLDRLLHAVIDSETEQDTDLPAVRKLLIDMATDAPNF